MMKMRISPIWVHFNRLWGVGVEGRRDEEGVGWGEGDGIGGERVGWGGR
jgi:hypothetical protein